MTAQTWPGLDRRLTLAFGLSMFNVGGFYLSLSPALRAVSLELEASPAHLGLPASLYGACLGIAALCTSLVLDRFDRKSIYLGGVALHAIGILMISYAPDWSTFSLGWTLCGIGAGALQPSAYAMISDATSDDTRASALGRVNVGWALATLVGVPACAYLVDILGWRSAMLSFSAIWFVAAILAAWYFAQQPPREEPEMDKSKVWSRQRFLALRTCRLHWLFVATVLIFIGFYGLYSFIGIAASERLNLDAGTVGLLVGVYGLGFLIGTLNTSLIDRIGHVRSLIASTIVLSIILASIPLALVGIRELALLMFLWGMFQVGAFTSLTAIAGSVVQNLRGMALSFNAAAVMTGASLGAGMMGYALSITSFQTVGVLCGVATLLAALIVGAKVRACTNP